MPSLQISVLLSAAAVDSSLIIADVARNGIGPDEVEVQWQQLPLQTQQHTPALWDRQQFCCRHSCDDQGVDKISCCHCSALCLF